VVLDACYFYARLDDWWFVCLSVCWSRLLALQMMKVWDAVWEADSHGPKVLLAAMRAKMEWLLFKLQTISRKSSCLGMMYCSEEATQHGQ